MSVNEPALCLGRRLGGQLPTASNRPQHQAEEAAPTWIPYTHRGLFLPQSLILLGPNTIHFLKFPLKYKSPWEGCCWNSELTPT